MKATFAGVGKIFFAMPGRRDVYNEMSDNAARSAVTDRTRQRKERLNASLGVAGFRQRMEIEMRSQVICAVIADHLEAR